MVFDPNSDDRVSNGGENDGGASGNRGDAREGNVNPYQAPLSETPWDDESIAVDALPLANQRALILIVIGGGLVLATVIAIVISSISLLVLAALGRLMWVFYAIGFRRRYRTTGGKSFAIVAMLSLFLIVITIEVAVILFFVVCLAIFVAGN